MGILTSQPELSEERSYIPETGTSWYSKNRSAKCRVQGRPAPVPWMLASFAAMTTQLSASVSAASAFTIIVSPLSSLPLASASAYSGLPLAMFSNTSWLFCVSFHFCSTTNCSHIFCLCFSSRGRIWLIQSVTLQGEVSCCPDNP